MDILKIAHSIYIDFSKEELEKLENDFKVFKNQLEILDNIDTSNTEMMYYPFSENENTLRSDDISSSLDVSDVLYNSKEVKDNMNKIIKVVG